MNEIEEKDYDAARGYADLIKINADNIMQIFNDIDNAMKSLYGESWQSTGADVSNEKYQEIRSKYEGFYEKVINMKEHIYTITARNEETDTAAAQAISNI